MEADQPVRQAAKALMAPAAAVVTGLILGRFATSNWTLAGALIVFVAVLYFAYAPAGWPLGSRREADNALAVRWREQNLELTALLISSGFPEASSEGWPQDTEALVAAYVHGPRNEYVRLFDDSRERLALPQSLRQSILGAQTPDLMWRLVERIFREVICVLDPSMHPNRG